MNCVAMHQSFEPTFECPSFGCPMCNGETCSTCGAGYLTREIALYECEHDVLERHAGQIEEEQRTAQASPEKP